MLVGLKTTEDAAEQGTLTTHAAEELHTSNAWRTTESVPAQK